MQRWTPLLAILLATLVGAFMARGSKSPAVLGNLVWDDVNRNGVQDRGEPGVNGVVVKAFRSDSGQLLTTQVTRSEAGQDGFFAFAIEPPLVIYLEFELPRDFQFTAPKQGGDVKLDSDANPLSGRTETIRVDPEAAGRVDAHWDAGLVRKLYERADELLRPEPEDPRQ